MNRISLEKIAIDTAWLWAERGTCCKKSIGAVILTSEGRVIATAYNGAPAGLPHCVDVGCELDEQGDCKRAVHAEANALIVAGRQAKGGRLFVTHFPCESCALHIIAAGIREVHFQLVGKDNAKHARALKLFGEAKITVWHWNNDTGLKVVV